MPYFTGHQGVQGDKRHQKERPKSCHNVGCAVDITSISCQNPKIGLHDFATAMQGTLTLVCYQDIGKGVCLPGHSKHAHIGRREYTLCADSAVEALKNFTLGK